MSSVVVSRGLGGDGEEGVSRQRGTDRCRVLLQLFFSLSVFKPSHNGAQERSQSPETTLPLEPNCGVLKRWSSLPLLNDFHVAVARRMSVRSAPTCGKLLLPQQVAVAAVQRSTAELHRAKPSELPSAVTSSTQTLESEAHAS